MGILRRLSLSCALLGLACAPSGAEFTSRRAAIIGGTFDPGDPAVVALGYRDNGGYGFFCSGTLIAPSTVLTAAHCVESMTPGSEYTVQFGSNAWLPTKTVDVASQFFDQRFNGISFDYGVLRLATPVTDVVPVTLNDVPVPPSAVGTTIRHVGYGVREDGDVGVKYEASYPIRALNVGLIESGAIRKQFCAGDSGGPGFIIRPEESTEVQASVNSWGDRQCEIGLSSRVDNGLDWIRPTMDAWEPPRCEIDGHCVEECLPIDQDCACKADGRCTTECQSLGRDPDCPADCAINGVCSLERCFRPDPDCVEEGEACVANTDCFTRLCVSDPQHGGTYCSSACTNGKQCEPGFECSEGVCRKLQKPMIALGESCAPDDFCAEGICTGPHGDSRCVKPCPCASGEQCATGADHRSYCRLTIVEPAVIEVRAPGETLGASFTGCSSTSALGVWSLVALLIRRRARRTHQPQM